MSGNMPVRASSGALLCALALTAVPGGAATLSGHAGLDGRARAGRWMPVEVTVEASTAVDGTLSVEWGGSRTERPVFVPEGTRRTLSFILRTGDPRNRVQASLDVAGASPVGISIPVAVDSSDAPLVVCVNGAADPSCTTSLPSERTPRAWRDYDVADEVHAGTERALSGEQRDALAVWAGRRQAEVRFGMPVAPARLSSGPPSRRVLPWLGLALVPPLAGGLAGRRHRRARAVAFAATLGLVTAGAAATGRLPPRLAVRHATTLHAFAGTAATLVESRFVVDTGTEGRIDLILAAPGGVLDRPGATRTPSRLTADGLPAVTIDGRMGATYAFEAEFAGPPSPVRIARTEGGVTIENRSPQALSDCSWPAAFGSVAPMTLEPGARWATREPISEGDILTCTGRVTLPLAGPAAGGLDGPGTLMVHLDTVLP